MQQGQKQKGLPVKGLLVLILWFFMVFMCIPFVKAQPLRVVETNGIDHAFYTENIQRINFSKGKMNVVEFGRQEVSFSIEGIKHLKFSDYPIVNRVSGFFIDSLQVKIYPNPAVNVLNISACGSSRPFFLAEIHSVEGKVLIKKRFDNIDDVMQVNVERLPYGLYICHLNDGKVITTHKFIKN